MELTIADIKELLSGQCGTDSHSFTLGEKYFVRTVTYHCVGRLRDITATDLKLEDAAWVADSGRWNEALSTGKLNEVEPFPSYVIISRAAIVDATPWVHDLPRETK